MKILVPMDGSLASFKAATKAVEIAKKHSFELKLITVVDHDKILSHRRSEKLWRQVDGSIISGKSGSIGEDNIADSLRSDAEEFLDSMIDRLDLCDMKVEKGVLLGEPYAEILECARRDQVALIVMGNRGFSKIKRFFVGSVTQRVISEAPCPVLVIHADAEE